MAKNIPSDVKKVRSEYARILNSLFSTALKTSPFDTVCSLLRAGGLQDANWDPFEESRDAFEDYNWILEKTLDKRGKSAGRRVGLLMYCQAIEMSAVHEILANLLRCISNEGFIIDPFSDLVRSKKGKLFTLVPPSVNQKFKRVKELAISVNQNQLFDVIDRIFDNGVRNAFSHSDYILTDKHFRFNEGGVAKQVDVKVLDGLIAECFAFYGVFMGLHREWLHLLGKGKRFHKWSNYRVFELLSSEDEGLYGFNVHFSNGSKAIYTRRKTGTNATNISFNNDGSITFMVGIIDKMEPVWKINGKSVEDWSALE